MLRALQCVVNQSPASLPVSSDNPALRKHVSSRLTSRYCGHYQFWPFLAVWAPFAPFFHYLPHCQQRKLATDWPTVTSPSTQVCEKSSLSPSIPRSRARARSDTHTHTHTLSLSLSLSLGNRSCRKSAKKWCACQKNCRTLKNSLKSYFWDAKFIAIFIFIVFLSRN
jgi:hypothetical protein